MPAATNIIERFETVAEHLIGLVVVGYKSKQLLVLGISACVGDLTDRHLHHNLNN